MQWYRRRVAMVAKQAAWTIYKMQCCCWKTIGTIFGTTIRTTLQGWELQEPEACRSATGYEVASPDNTAPYPKPGVNDYRVIMYALLIETQCFTSFEMNLAHRRQTHLAHFNVCPSRARKTRSTQCSRFLSKSNSTMFTLDPTEESPGLLTLSVARLLFPIIGVFGLEPGGMMTTSEIRKLTDFRDSMEISVQKYRLSFLINKIPW